MDMQVQFPGVQEEGEAATLQAIQEALQNMQTFAG